MLEATWSWPELGPEGSDVSGYIEIQGSTGTVTGYMDEQGQDYLRVHSRLNGERLIPIEGADSDTVSIQAEIENFVKSIQSGVPSILDAGVGAGVIGVLNCAQLSELRGRVTVTFDKLADFSQHYAQNASDPWKAGDHIISALYAPYRQS